MGLLWLGARFLSSGHDDALSRIVGTLNFPIAILGMLLMGKVWDDGSPGAEPGIGSVVILVVAFITQWSAIGLLYSHGLEVFISDLRSGRDVHEREDT